RGITVDIKGLTLSQGKADQGGAVRNAGRLTLENDVVSQSQANAVGMGILGGGGILNQAGATLILLNCRVSDNQALGDDYGGGILNQAGATLQVTSSTIVSNKALSTQGGGGGVWNDGTATFLNDFLGYNQSPGGGGTGNDGTLTVIGSTFQGNRA